MQNKSSLFVVAFLSLWIALYLFYSRFVFISPSQYNNWQMSDFVYYSMLVRSFWFDGLDNIYSLEANLKAISELIGPNAAPLAMPVGLTPLLLITYCPLALFSFIGFEFAQSLWMSLSLSLLLGQLYCLIDEQIENKKYFFGACGLAFLSSCFISTLILGQTSIIAIALLLYFWRKFSANQAEDLSVNSFLTITMATIVLGIKLHYYAIFLALMILFSRWRLAVFSICIFTFSLFALNLKLDPAWFADFLKNLGVFTSGEIPQHYLHAFGLHRVNSFFSAFNENLGARYASQLPSIILAVSFLTLSLKKLLEDLRSSSNQKATARFVLLVSSYLLLAPYVATYEELMLVLIAIIFWCENSQSTSKVRAYALCLAFLLLLNFTAIPGGETAIWIFWFSKFALLGTLCFLSYRKKPSSSRA